MYLANTMRRVLLVFAFVLLSLILFGVIGPHASAQSRSIPIDSNWAGLSMQIQSNVSDISQLKKSIEKIDLYRLPERMVLIEYKLDKIEWLSSAIVIGLMGLMVERLWPKKG